MSDRNATHETTGTTPAAPKASPRKGKPNRRTGAEKPAPVRKTTGDKKPAAEKSTPKKSTATVLRGRQPEAIAAWLATPGSSLDEIADTLGIDPSFGQQRGHLLLQLVRAGAVHVRLDTRKAEALLEAAKGGETS